MKTVPAYLVGAITFLVTTCCGNEFWARHTIDPADSASGRKGADGVRLGDIDGDGLPDIVTGWEEGGAIRVCLNPGPESADRNWRGVTVGLVKGVEDAVFGDLDGDGRLDVISSAEGKTQTVSAHWAPAPDMELTDETLWKTTALPATEKQQRWMFCLPYDVDHDKDLDLILGSKDGNASISWLENPGHKVARQVDKWKLHKVCDAAWIMTLAILQSGEEDYLLASDRKGAKSGIYLIPLRDEAPWIGKPRLIGGSSEEVMFLDLAHLDDDDRLDVVASIKDNQTRILYQPEEPLAPWVDSSDLDPYPLDQFGSAKAVKVGDLTGDEIPDFIISCERAEPPRQGVFMGDVFSSYSDISGPSGIKFDRIELLDLDNDGDLDVITCEERDQLGVFWYENPLK